MSALNTTFIKDNKTLKALASDSIFIKSLTLMIPTSPEVEKFFTKLRKDLLLITVQDGKFPSELRSLAEALASQCYLNEYIYYVSEIEQEYLDQIISIAARSQEESNDKLALIGCYKAIYTTKIPANYIGNYPADRISSSELIKTQFTEPNQEKNIQSSIVKAYSINDKISKIVQNMYEENPYPRFKCTNFTDQKIRNPIFKYIENETARRTTFLSAIKILDE